MKMMLAMVLALAICAGAPVYAGGKIHPRLSEALRVLSPSDRTLAWVFFTDKGSHEVLKAAVPRTVVSQRSFLRRLKARPSDTAVDYTDLPVERSYVEQLSSRGARVRQISKWFNGVSVNATKEQLAQIESLPFVATIDLLARFKRNHSEAPVESSPPSTLLQADKSNAPTSLAYGLSFAQLNQINVPAVHNTGNYGQGVFVGVFDNGFRLLNHEAFDTLRTRIVATYDFVDKKISVVPNDPSTETGAHGIITLSTIGGYKADSLIGPAFGASYILARTENDSSETPFEEDNWVAAIEWADSIGVDVTSTSLGYLTYDPPYNSWRWEDLNGNTTVITRAADMAVSKGIVVCNSAGNNGFNATRNTLNAPADGDSVLSVGAVNPDGNRSSFSSVGPTTSVPARIKPDVMAQGSSVRCASPTVPTAYTYSRGTSLSCPLAAGVAALLIRAKPTAGPIEIMNAMRQTASNASSPDNFMGWGTINAMRAMRLLTGGGETPSAFKILRTYPNPFNPSITMTLKYALPKSAHVVIKIFDLLGQEVRTLVNEVQAASEPWVHWDAKNNGNNALPTGVYFARLTATPVSGGDTYQETVKLILLK